MSETAATVLPPRAQALADRAAAQRAAAAKPKAEESPPDSPKPAEVVKPKEIPPLRGGSLRFREQCNNVWSAVAAPGAKPEDYHHKPAMWAPEASNLHKFDLVELSAHDGLWLATFRCAAAWSGYANCQLVSVEEFAPEMEGDKNIVPKGYHYRQGRNAEEEQHQIRRDSDDWEVSMGQRFARKSDAEAWIANHPIFRLPASARQVP